MRIFAPYSLVTIMLSTAGCALTSFSSKNSSPIVDPNSSSSGSSNGVGTTNGSGGGSAPSTGTPCTSSQICSVDPNFSNPNFAVAGTCFPDPNTHKCSEGFTCVNGVNGVNDPVLSLSTSTPSCQVLQPVNLCVVDPNAQLPTGKTATGACSPTNGSCPTGFVNQQFASPIANGYLPFLATTSPYPSTWKSANLTPQASSCAVVKDPGQRCVPEPACPPVVDNQSSYDTNTCALFMGPGGPRGSCLPESNNSCPSDFIIIKSVAPVDPSGCYLLQDMTL